ncbi:MAG: MBL fold metallo-hydrolase [Erysipelotrichaceae bacterium]|nr:MBL fold metallo-hydrolase [Erysipelotrichaceae bacterium]
MIRITSLGGSGEDSRNCFLIESDEANILLDCGVRREIADTATVYPALSREIAEKLDAVVISHGHEDHTAALPYLYELGYRGKIYASLKTIEVIPGYLRKWIRYVKDHEGTLPFDEENVEKLEYETIENYPFPIEYGRSGHMIGSLWYLFTLEGHRILYTGDLTYDGMVLKADKLPLMDTLIIDSAYASRSLSQYNQYLNLLNVARDTVSDGGMVLLPVPANGRGIDLFLYLSLRDLPVFAEENIVRNTEDLKNHLYWLRDPEIQPGEYYLINNENRQAILEEGIPGVYLFADGMMTSAISPPYFNAVKDSEKNIILITGHTARGTMANDLLSVLYRDENNISCRVAPLTIKVHPDEEDVETIIGFVKPHNVILFHSRREKARELKKKLEEKGLRVICGTGETLVI